MKRIYCDICETEIKKATYITLPTLYSGEVVDGAERRELCANCAREIYNIVEEYRNKYGKSTK